MWPFGDGRNGDMKPSVRLSLGAIAGLSLAGTISACSAPAPADTSAEYTDGTYFAEGQYVSPGATETVGVELTLADDIVTAVQITTHGESANARRFQGEFAGGIGAEVIGKDIDSLNVSRVAG